MKRGRGIALGVFVIGRFFGQLGSLPMPHKFKGKLWNAHNLWSRPSTLYRMSKYGEVLSAQIYLYYDLYYDVCRRLSILKGKKLFHACKKLLFTTACDS